MTTQTPAWAEATLRWLDIPVSDNAVAAVVAVLDAYEKRWAAEHREPSEEEKRKERERDERIRQHRREEILTEMRRLQGNTNGNAAPAAQNPTS